MKTRCIPVLAALAFSACTGGEDSVETPSLGALLARGAAHAEIDQWVDAQKLFQQATELYPGESAAAYDLAITSFRAGDRRLAGDHLERARENAPQELLAKIELLRGKLAYEDGDVDAELAAHREASRLAPEEAAYAYALAEIHLRRGQEEERGAMLERSHELWTENAYLAAELALWVLAQGDGDVRRRGLTLLETLIDKGSQAGSFLEKGRAELKTAAGAPSSGVPRSLRIAVNLLRATKRFQSDATDLQSRLEPTPLAQPVSGQPASPGGGRSGQFLAAGPEIRFEAASLLPDLPLESGEQVLDVVLFDDSTEGRPGAAREAGLALLSDNALYVLPREARGFLRLAEVVGVRQLLAGDIDDDLAGCCVELVL